MCNGSVLSLYVVGLKELISQSFLHSFVAQIASSTVIFVSTTFTFVGQST